MLGTLRLNLSAKSYYTVTGGPFRDAAPGYTSVKMAAEIDLPCDIDIATEDFSVPPRGPAMRGLISAIDCILEGRPVYVGCMAGRGRTGLFMALLAKAFGEDDPVRYVRANYYAHAVETHGQLKYVNDFTIPSSVLRRIRWARVRAFFRKRGNLTYL